MSLYDDPHVSAGEIADYLHSPSPTMERHPDDTDHDLPAQLPLMPCPFCGETPLLLPGHNHGFFVGCEGLHCPVNPELTFTTETAEQAAERWNTRPSPQAA